ncbi:aspartic peptidase domain-containing protein [Cladorrhinum sp. PSN259]|nr:aspartic peptidase domain-containing protein [Cladorrhinum sp. PSN259]
MEHLFQTQLKLRTELDLHKVKAIRNMKFVRHGTNNYLSAMNRYGFQPTKPGPYTYSVARNKDSYGFSGKYAVGAVYSLWTSLVGQQTDEKPDEKPDEVPAEDQNSDMEYLCEVEIGSPPQKALLDFDTGSADLWVRPEIFKNDNSTTFKLLDGKSWKIQYGDGSSASGFVGSDLVSIGGLTIKDQAIEVAKHISPQFSQGKIGGLLGLAFKQINTVYRGWGTRDPQPTPVDNMITQEDIPKEAELFTTAFYSSRDKDKSYYTFGWIDQDLVKQSGEEISWAPIDNSEGFWMFKSESATVNGNKITLSGNKAIADTGTTLALISDEACETLYKSIKGSSYSEKYQGYIIPKSTKVDELPEFSVAVGDKEFVIQKEDLILADADDDNWYGGVQSRGQNPFDILGDTFLKSIYAIFDQGNSRFGAVPKVEQTQDITPSSAPPPESDKGKETASLAGEPEVTNPTADVVHAEVCESS